jgi:autophagy-related protein 16
MEDVYNLIQQRNAYETTPFLPIHASNIALSNLADTLQARCESLEKQYYLEQQQLLVEANQLSEKTQEDGEQQYNNNSNNNDSSSLAISGNTRLRGEVAQLHKALREKIKKELTNTNNNNNTEANATLQTTKEIAQLKEINSTQSSQISNLKVQLSRTTDINTHLQSELDNANTLTRLSEKQFVGLKSAIRELQSENDEKSALNERLIQEAVYEKEKFAEQLNSMNDMVEKLQKEIEMLKLYNKNSSSGGMSWFGLTNGRESIKGGVGTASSSSSSSAAAAVGVDTNNNNETVRKWGAFGAILPSKPLYTIKAHREDASCVTYDGTNLNLVATTSSDATIRVFDTSNGQLQSTFSAGGGSLPMTGVDISGGIVTACGADKTCRVWQYNTRRLIHQLAGHSQKITCVKLFPGEKHIVTGSADRSIRIWDISRHIYTQTITFRHSSTSNCCDVAMMDTQPVITGHLDGGVRFWDVRGGSEVLDIPSLHEGGVTSVQWKPGSSHYILTCGRDSTLKIIDGRNCSSSSNNTANSSCVVKTFSNRALRIMSNNARCSYSPDPEGKYVACGGGDTGDLFVFDVASCELKKRLSSAHKAGVVGLAWGKGGTNGQQIATVDKSGVLVLWA